MKTVSGPYEQTALPSGGAHELGAGSRRALLLALLVGLAGAVLMLLYLRRYEQEVSGGGRVAVLGLRKPVARGELITDDALAVFEIPLAYVERRVVKQVDRQKVIGVRAASALTAQDSLLWSDLALSSENRDLASLIQPGKRAVTVRASEAGSDPAGNGLVRPGDYVDVVVTLHDAAADAALSSVVLLQRILVLAVGSETQPAAVADAPAARSSHESQRELTLSLKMEEVQLLSLARQRGTLSVALRGPSDTKVIESIPDVSLTSLYDRVLRESLAHSDVRATPALPVRVLAGAR
jgi:pilus assembly protein CpaB